MALFARTMTPEERAQVETLARSSDAVTFRHARTVLLSAQGRSVVEIAEALGVTERTARSTLYAFNRVGVPALPRRKAPGKVRICNEEARQALLELLRHPPTDYGIQSALWSAADLAAVAKRLGIVPDISHHTVRREVLRSGYRWQRAKRWSSPDPDYEKKGEAEAPEEEGAG